MKYYDRPHNRLVFINEKATPEFWDEHWEKENYRERIITGKNDRFIINTTKKYISTGRILEGGCGMGGKVYALHHHGYEAFGVDFAIKTVQKIHASVPELKVFPADVMHLPFSSSSFDGYWSLGVIEHFYEGYGAIADEMERVLKPGGFLFVTFPSMSLLRRLKARLGLYPEWDESGGSDLFYQFALNQTHVIDEFEKRGFLLLERRSNDGLKGLKDEIFLVKIPLQRLYDYSGKNIIIKFIRLVLHKTCEPFTGHTTLLVLRKV